jgi:hypothetical protein
MVSCPGCLQSFSATGYSQHLAKTTQAPCKAVLTASRAHTHPHAPSAPAPAPAPPSLAEEQDQPSIFEGDFFGTYEEDDLEWSDNNNSDSSDEEEDLDSEEWEPPAQGDNESSHSNDSGTEESADQQAHRQQIEELNMGQNIVIIPYPDAHAGKPITGQPSGANATYGINAGSAANVYAPFASQMDWDIAKWAKLRGSSSTAFTDLLSTDGVRDSAKVYF